ncbi:MAG: type III-A CRISPR-associated RAMP protein Csm3 [Ktedonobacteraceae bacterium]
MNSADSAAPVKRYDLHNRYMLTGQLRMQTGFHIGGGNVTLSNSNSPVVLTPERQPFIPGASFKGALRSSVERLVSGLPVEVNLYSCGLADLSDDERNRSENSASRLCSTQRQKEITTLCGQYPAQEKVILDQARANLCDTCNLFGSPFVASRVNISDLYLVNSEWANIIQRRDGVAIDRDSEKAKDHLKYNFEVVPASTIFKLQITLENATQKDLQLLSIGLSEFTYGFGVIGGRRSQGLGICLLENLQVAALELEGVEEQARYARLRNYLLRREFSSHRRGEDFLNEHIDSLFNLVL